MLHFLFCFILCTPFLLPRSPAGAGPWGNAFVFRAAPEFRDRRTFIPVSYTHLDVYKRQLYAEILRLCVQRGGPISGQEAKKRGGAPGRRPAERAGLTPAQIIAVGLPRKKPRRVRSRRREFSSDPFSPATCVSGKTLLRLPVCCLLYTSRCV